MRGLGPLQPVIPFQTYGCWRLDPQSHARDRQAHHRRDDADAGGTSDLRRGDPSGGRRG